MSKKCARPECGKTVYPIEELRCLDKSWHKQCFKCTVCGMTLNMKNYKGYDKMPYCEPHYPKTVASVVTDTPEMRRLAENTRLQSNIKYHEDFEKSKGQKINICDDPEMTRHLQNSKVQSQVLYHGEIEKKKHMDEIRPQAEIIQHASEQPQDHTSGIPTLPASNVSPESPSTYAPPPNASTPYSKRMASQSGTVIYSSEKGGKGQMTGKQLNTQQIGRNQPSTQNMAQTGSETANGGARGTDKGTKAAGFTVKAIYDYTAADRDEVSFVEGDIIVNCQKVDEGWMTGTVQRTRQWGMLPANYVERVKQTGGLQYLS
ncbi:hypothetical protein AB6A40_001171 [Gnathostoma spinigerum]|uniref:LIM and SH3 domain protein F42H10.3 n=1 Tax=Gnathostoma spinigerum TaxID=75299 RepID=A0ABD6ECP2_9BILA